MKKETNRIKSRTRKGERFQAYHSVCLFVRLQIVWFCFLLGITLYLNTSGKFVVQAASASISLEIDDGTIRVGDTIVVRLVVESSERIGDFEAFLTYQSAVLEFQESEVPAMGGEGMLRISDIEPMERTRNRTYELNFKAIAVGGCEIAIQEKAHVYADDGGKEMSVSSNTLSIRVEAAETASSETSLRELKISPGSLEPAFSEETTEYTLEVGAEITSLVISAIPKDTAATIAVSGNQNFSDGENVVNITVTAENADSRIYRIRVFKNRTENEGAGNGSEYSNNSSEETETNQNPEAEEPDVDQKNEEPEENRVGEDEFYLEEKGDAFLFSGRYRYQIAEAPQTARSGLPKGYESYTLVLFGKQVPAYRKIEAEGNAGEASQTLVYVEGRMDEEGELFRGDAGFYEFDLESKNMVKIQFRDQEKELEIIKEVDTEAPWILYIIIVGLAVLCTFFGIGLIQLGRKYYSVVRDEIPGNPRQGRR